MILWFNSFASKSHTEVYINLFYCKEKYFRYLILWAKHLIQCSQIKKQNKTKQNYAENSTIISCEFNHIPIITLFHFIVLFCFSDKFASLKTFKYM